VFAIRFLNGCFLGSGRSDQAKPTLENGQLRSSTRRCKDLYAQVCCDYLTAGPDVIEARMTLVRIRDWLEIVGLFSVVVSLLFVGVQLAQDRRIAVLQGLDSRVQTSWTLAEQIGENADLWRRGLDGEELSPEEDVRFLALASSMHLYFRVQEEGSELGEDDGDWHVRDFAFAVYQHPGLQRYWQHEARRIELSDRASGFEPEFDDFSKAVYSKLAQMKRSDVPVPEEKVYVFW
jgi:hypothetical protein